MSVVSNWIWIVTRCQRIRVITNCVVCLFVCCLTRPVRHPRSSFANPSERWIRIREISGFPRKRGCISHLCGNDRSYIYVFETIGKEEKMNAIEHLYSPPGNSIVKEHWKNGETDYRTRTQHTPHHQHKPPRRFAPCRFDADDILGRFRLHAYETQQLPWPTICVELLGDSHQPMTGRLATHPSNTTVNMQIPQHTMSKIAFTSKPTQKVHTTLLYSSNYRVHACHFERGQHFSRNRVVQP